MITALIITNLTSPTVLCFLIGAFAVLLKSDLRVREAKSSFGFMPAYGTMAPLVFGCLGVILGHRVGASPEGVAILATMAASASYIAPQVAVRMSLPDANPRLYLTARISNTLPFNIAVGRSLYFARAAS